jgi:tetratricopeptide (TPR) repeat protein
VTPEIEQLYQRAIELANSGDCESAMELLAGVDHRASSVPLAVRLKIIHCAVKLGKHEFPPVPEAADSLTAFEAAAWIQAALSLQEAGRPDLAALMFDRLMQTSSMPKPFRGHGLWHAVVGRLAFDPQSAESLIPGLLGYEDDDPPAGMLWGKAIECLAWRSRVEDGDVDFIWRKLPGSTTADIAGVLMQAAFTLEFRGHLDAARFSYEKLVSMDGVPESILVNARLRLGIVLDGLGLWESAVREYEAAVRIPCEANVARSQAVFRLAQVREMAEEYSDAAELFDGLRSDNLLDTAQREQAQLRYAICLLKAGNKEQAQQELETCRRAAGDTSLKADMALAELHESTHDVVNARKCYERVLANPAAEPVAKAAALSRLRRLR